MNMLPRTEMTDKFLIQAGWLQARREPLAGDASFRRYERVWAGDRVAVLMDAPPEKEDVSPFLHVADLLETQGLSAPRVLAQNVAQGLLLLEDLGDALFAALLRHTPEREGECYRAAAEVLLHLLHHRESIDSSTLPLYDEALYLREAHLLTEWLLPACTESAVLADASAEYDTLMREALAHLPPLPSVLTLRDYHAENLLWLPSRRAAANVGLLDFQDAVQGSPVYDLVSLLEDARRDVSAASVEATLAHYITQSGLPPAQVKDAYALLGAQRNCKILGIFARLALRDGKAHYLRLMPRVWGHLERDLRHPLLAPLRDWMERRFPLAWRGALALCDGALQRAA